MNWHTYCWDLISQWGGITSAASQARICLRADEINLCWSMARIEPLPNEIGWLPDVAPSTPRLALKYKGDTRRACPRKHGALRKAIEIGSADDTVRVLRLVSPESVSCGVTDANFGVLGFSWSDCMVIFWNIASRRGSWSEALSGRRVLGVHKCGLANGNAAFQSRAKHALITSTSFDAI